MGKLPTARGQKTGQILGPRHGKVLLASGEMTSADNDLAMALSSGSKDLDDRIQELAARVMDEGRKDPESVMVQDPWFSQLDWRPKKRKDEEKPKAPAICWPKWYWDLTRPKRGSPPGTIELHRSYSSWRGEVTLCFIRENTGGYTAFLLPSRRLPSTDRL